MARVETEQEPEDWTNGLCKKCKKFVMDGQGFQELIRGEISRFCLKCFKPRAAAPSIDSGKV